jgi:hypothetical protein
MTHTKKFIFFNMMFITSTMLYGQSSPVSSGGHASGSGGSMTITIGLSGAKGDDWVTNIPEFRD